SPIGLAATKRPDHGSRRPQLSRAERHAFLGARFEDRGTTKCRKPSMGQLNFVGVRRLQWPEVPEPQLGGSREALVRPIAVARCDLDPVFINHSLGWVLRAGIASHQIDRSATEAIRSE